ncbi:MAG TPA: cofactor-independent phosphoglycerate mutase [Syntrophorhabdaceae bacterium]|nr:cofactor-independent phosphoglycerate mutase [Syntrophorhabdaceae bacterium]HNT67810.1 cofactor-independent phosphoglycerate mutase [Syntrophorhabdaceae bacterium]
MKYVVIIGDGMADFPLEELGGKTPLMAANKPYIDRMAREGFCGKVVTVPEGFSPGSDVACMSIFGYDPAKYYTGRAPIEASGMGIEMGDDDVAFRCNLVHLAKAPGGTLMGDYSGGHITTGEAHVLIKDLQNEIGGDEFVFFPGVSYRHIMIWKGGLWTMKTTPPHDITEKEIGEYLPDGDGAAVLTGLMERAQAFLASHPLNKRRESEGRRPANSVWLWGQGKKARFPSFKDLYGVRGATVAAVDLIKGISRLAGFDAPYIEGATGYLDTDYKAKAATALKLLEDHDIVYVHIEAPDEASHNGNVAEKIRAIENIDREVVSLIYEKSSGGTRFLIVTDHATPISMKTHYACPVPFIMYDKDVRREGCQSGYSEQSGDAIMSGEEMIGFFLKGQAR